MRENNNCSLYIFGEHTVHILVLVGTCNECKDKRSHIAVAPSSGVRQPTAPTDLVCLQPKSAYVMCESMQPVRLLRHAVYCVYSYVCVVIRPRNRLQFSTKRQFPRAHKHMRRTTANAPHSHLCALHTNWPRLTICTIYIYIV